MKREDFAPPFLYVDYLKDMLPIPGNVLAQFNEVLIKRVANKATDVHYRKWLRYFSGKYDPPEAKSEQVRLFIEKLKSKMEIFKNEHLPATPVIAKTAFSADSLCKRGNDT